jgi:hypothetical protein
VGDGGCAGLPGVVQAEWGAGVCDERDAGGGWAEGLVEGVAEVADRAKVRRGTVWGGVALAVFDGAGDSGGPDCPRI